MLILQVEPYQVNLNPDLESQLQSIVNEMGLEIVPPVSVTVSLCVCLPPPPLLLPFFPGQVKFGQFSHGKLLFLKFTA